MSIEKFGTYNGIPIYVDPYAEKDRVTTMKKQESKPMRGTQSRNPRTKGLQHADHNITAIIMHPDMAKQLEDETSDKIILKNGTT